MGIQSIQKQNVVNAVYEQMKEKLLDGTWGVGSKLPSEGELAESFNVSRVSIRSAVQRLRDLGIVATQQGKGTHVVHVAERDSFDGAPKPIMHLSREEFMDMMVFRQTVEFKCMELAVVNATADDVQALEQALSKMLSAKEDYKKYSQADFEFHLAIAKASKNQVFYRVMKSIKDMYYYYLEELNRSLGITMESVEAHIQIFLAIKHKDAARAATVLDAAMADNIHAIERLKNESTGNAPANVFPLKSQDAQQKR